MMIFELSVLAGLILLNGFLAMSEFAVVSARAGRLRQLAQKGRKGPAIALELQRNSTGFLSTVQIGITLVGIFAGAYGGTTLSRPLAGVLEQVDWLEQHSSMLAFVLVVVATTYATLVVGELVPKRIALSNAESVASMVSRPMRMLAVVTAPLVWFLTWSTLAVTRALGVPQKRDEPVSEEEVRAMIAQGTKAGVFKPTEREMLEGVIRVADRTVRSVMTPRPEVVVLDADAPAADILDLVGDSAHSRYPVCRGGTDNIVGIVRVRDMLRQMRRTGDIDIDAILIEPPFVSDTLPALKLPDKFRRASVHMAVIFDERGAFEGIATPTNVLEGIAGDLYREEVNREPDAVQRADGSWLLSGAMQVHAVERHLQASGMAGASYETLAGFVLQHLGHLPDVGACFSWNGWRFEVVDMDGRRIDRVLAVRAGSAEGSGEQPR